MVWVILACAAVGVWGTAGGPAKRIQVWTWCRDARR
jgi:hypothetical protein